ncbi:acyl-CoA dehydrogenase [Silvanigrella aquatica]|uniref:Acyl-CoA dehydrogenase n=2 Tax=Silvanigrella aquatica TaxID=1915309 RepID=A0A1L4D4R5_9BACT|nr:acyl-CoA dehydrogenase [Silvanigrella aquatica]
METKKWGDSKFWGLDFELDPQWILSKSQKKLQEKLIDLCHSTLRKNAVESDRHLIYPRKNFEALAQLGLLGIIVPKELGGMGENHTCATMVVETISRYGCASTAMCYVMHLAATSALLLRYHKNPTIKSLLSRLNKDVLIGTVSYSDPQTGSHFWYHLSSKCEKSDTGWRVFKKSSWTTSGGFADWYVAQTTSPDFNGDYSNLSCFLLWNSEVKTNPSTWDGLGLRGNQSGALEIEGVEISHERMIGPVGDGARSNDESVDPFFLLCSSACWNGIAMGMIDIARDHTTRKKHEDVGMRIADYPTIQDYIGEAIIDTNSVRCFNFQIAQALDEKTNQCDWSIHEDYLNLPRRQMMHWLWQLKFSCSKNVTHVSDKMLHTCGGTGYKPALGIERYLRDAKAGWVMGPTNEVLRQFVGKFALFGPESLDYWNQSVNERVINNELKKMDKKSKREFAEKILKDCN